MSDFPPETLQSEEMLRHNYRLLCEKCADLEHERDILEGRLIISHDTLEPMKTHIKLLKQRNADLTAAIKLGGLEILQAAIAKATEREGE